MVHTSLFWFEIYIGVISRYIVIKNQRTLIILSGVYLMKNNVNVPVRIDSNREDNVGLRRTGSTYFLGQVEYKTVLSYKIVTSGRQNISGILLEGRIFEQSNIGGCDSGLLWKHCSFYIYMLRDFFNVRTIGCEVLLTNRRSDELIGS